MAMSQNTLRPNRDLGFFQQPSCRPVGFFRQIAAAWLFAWSASVVAGGAGGMGNVVYDPMNHVQTTISAANSVLQTAQMVQAYTLQIQQYLNELENLKRLPQETLNAVLQPYTDEISAAVNLSQTLGDTLAQIHQLQDDFTSQIRQMSAQGVTPAQYMDREMQIAQHRGTSVAAVFKNEVDTMQSVNDSFNRIKQLQQQIPASSGLQQSFQTVNQHLNLLAGQNAQLIKLIAGHQATQSAHQEDEDKANTVAGELIQKRRQDDSANIRQLHQQLREQESLMGWGLMGGGP